MVSRLVMMLVLLSISTGRGAVAQEGETPRPDRRKVLDESATRVFVRSITDRDLGAGSKAACPLFWEHFELVPAVVEALGKESYAARKRATWVLTSSGALRVERERGRAAYNAVRGLIPTLIEIANDPESFDRGSAGDWLGILLAKADLAEKQRQEATATVSVLLRDKCSYVRYRTLKGITLMGPQAKKPLVAAITGALDDPSLKNRSLAFGALKDMGADAKPAVPALLKALEDPERRSSAIDALKRIDPDALQAATHKAAKDAR